MFTVGEFLAHFSWGPLRVIFKYFLFLVFPLITCCLEVKKFSPLALADITDCFLQGSASPGLPDHHHSWCSQSFGSYKHKVIVTLPPGEYKTQLKQRQTCSDNLQYYIISTLSLVMAKVIFPGLHNLFDSSWQLSFLTVFMISILFTHQDKISDLEFNDMQPSSWENFLSCSISTSLFYLQPSAGSHWA